MTDIKMTEGETEEVPAEDVQEINLPDVDADAEEVIQALADVPPDTEIWTGGPTAETMLGWMEKHKNVYVTSISYEDHVAWRPLKRSEYARVSSEIEARAQDMGELELQMLNEEMVCRICVLYPDYSNIDFDDLLAGVPTLLSQQILERSGFTAIGLREMI